MAENYIDTLKLGGTDIPIQDTDAQEKLGVMGDELRSVKSAIGNLTTRETVMAIGAGTQGYGVRGTNINDPIGSAIDKVQTNNYCYWEIPLAGNIVALKVTVYNSTSKNYPYYVYFTDSNDVIIGVGVHYETLSQGLNTDKEAIVPSGAEKAYVLSQAQGYSNVVVKSCTYIDLQSQIDNLQDDIGEARTDIGSAVGTRESKPITSGDNGGVGGLGGAVGEALYIVINPTTQEPSQGYRHGYIAVSPGEMYAVKCIQSPSGTYKNFVYAVTDTISDNGEIVQLWGQSAEGQYEEKTYLITIPDGAAYLYVMANVNTSIADGATVAKIVHVDLQTQIISLQENDQIPEMVLPSKSYTKVGLEWNLYYANIFRSLPDKYNVKFTFTRANELNMPKFLDDCLRFTPINADRDLGDHTVTVTLQNRETGQLVDERSFVLTVLADTALSGKKVIFIGDSLTDADIIPAQIQHVLSGGGITSVGTIKNENVRIGESTYTVFDEGRSGWATYDYTRTNLPPNTEPRSGSNPFWNSTAEKFDFWGYIANPNQNQDQAPVGENNVSTPDAVVIGLGTNGLSNQDYAIAALDDMIKAIHNGVGTHNNLPILISLITPPATQDGCGNHNGIQCAAEQKRKQLDLVEKYIAMFDDTLEYPNVYVAELYFNLDTKRDFPTAQQDASARNPTKVTRQIDNVHPSEYGYLKMADVYYANLLRILS